MNASQVLVIGACALAAAGCSGLKELQSRAWKVEPEPAAVRHGMDAQSMYLIGRHFHRQGRYELAVTAYRDALAQAQGELAGQVRNALAVTYAAQGRYDAAIVELKAAVAADPDVAYLQSNLGYAYLLRGDDGEALRVLQEAARLHPDHAGTQRNLRAALARMGRAAESPQPADRAPSARLAPAALTHTAGKRPGPDARSARDPSLTIQAVSPGVYELREPARAAAPAVPVSEPLQGIPAKPYRLEVSNGNGVGGLAHRVAARLRTLGVNAVRLTNQVPPHRLTEVQYAQGYAAEAARLAATLNQRALMVASDRLRADIHVRLVLGADAPSVVALFEPAAAPRADMVAALNETGRR